MGGAALALALLWFLKTVPVRKRLLVVAALGLGMVVMAPPGYWDQMRTILNPTEDYNWSSPTGRRQIALRGLGYMWAYPVFGVGAGNFPRAEGMISDIATTQTADRGIRWMAAHNSFIQVGAEMGVTGLLLWTFLVFGGLVGMVRLRRRLPRWWARGDPEQRFLYASTMYIPAAYVAFVVPAFFLSVRVHGSDLLPERTVLRHPRGSCSAPENRSNSARCPAIGYRPARCRQRSSGNSRSRPGASLEPQASPACSAHVGHRTDPGPASRPPRATSAGPGRLRLTPLIPTSRGVTPRHAPSDASNPLPFPGASVSP